MARKSGSLTKMKGVTALPSHIAITAQALGHNVRYSRMPGLDLMHELYPTLFIREALEVFALIRDKGQGGVRKRAVTAMNDLETHFKAHPRRQRFGELMAAVNAQGRAN